MLWVLRRVLRRGSEKGFPRGLLEGRNTPVRRVQRVAAQRLGEKVGPRLAHSVRSRHGTRQWWLEPYVHRTSSTRNSFFLSSECRSYGQCSEIFPKDFQSFVPLFCGCKNPTKFPPYFPSISPCIEYKENSPTSFLRRAGKANGGNTPRMLVVQSPASFVK